MCIVQDMIYPSYRSRTRSARPAEAELLDGDSSEPITLLPDGETAGGRLSGIRSTFADGAEGAPSHLHADSIALARAAGGVA